MLALTNTAMSGNEAMTPQTTPTRCSRRGMPGTRRSLVCTRIVTTGDDVPLSVRDCGSHAAGHTVVLLHGFCLNKDSWKMQIGHLRRQYGDGVRIISYDHRGHGDSGAAPMNTYHIDRLAADLHRIIEIHNLQHQGRDALDVAMVSTCEP